MLRRWLILFLAPAVVAGCSDDDPVAFVDSGELSDGGRADATACEVSDSICESEDALLACVGGQLVRSDCPARTTCIPDRIGASCEPVVCDAGSVGCSNSRTAYTCENNGTVRAEFACGETEYCETGVCIEELCVPNSRMCRGDTVVECDGRGSEETVSRCSETDTCEASEHGCYCAEGACVERVCTPGRSQCVGAGVRVCSDDGSAFGEISACPDATQCVDGVCLETVCAPGERRCAGTTLLTCPAGATSWESADCADGGEVCRDFDGFADCGDAVCEPGTTDCTPDASSVRRCDGTGGNVEELSCGDGVCLDGACVPVACEAGSLFCEANEVRLCDSIGAASTPVTDCSRENVAVACEDGACAIVECAEGWGDCDESTGTGCETPLDSETDCGECGLECELPNTARTSCSDGTCLIAECADGWADCDGESEGCETDVTTVESCGACGVSCAVDGVETECHEGACRVTTCPEGTLDCDGDVENGCETAVGDTDCGECARDCTALPNAIAACDGVACVIEDCADGFADCDETADSGCESDLSALATCGSCENICAAEGATLECVDGACRLAGCAEGFADCDERVDTGCESDLASVETCDACDVSCAVENGTASCEAGRCRVAECNDSWGDCDFRYDTGCETPLDTTTDCGECAAECEGGAGGDPLCADGSCAFECDLGRGDCDGSRESGCETNTDVSMEHCGACDAACDLEGADSVCVLGTCVIDNCASWLDNCDGVDSTGCESDLLADTADCGTCGLACTGGECFDGVCPENSFVEIDAYNGHGCGLLESGAVICWGLNDHGQLGRGTSSGEIEAFAPALIDDATSVHTGNAFTCALREDLTLVCWGEGAELPGSDLDRLEPTDVVLDNVRAFDAHDRALCALTDAGAECWGLETDTVGVLGTVVGEFGSLICTGWAFACATTDTGGVSCWGHNGAGQLGDGTTTSRETAAPVAGVEGAIGLACGYAHACAVLESGRVVCWGQREQGQLGRAGATDDSTRPAAVVGLADTMIGVSASRHSTCAWSSDAVAYCWGARNGLGSSSNRAGEPLPVRGAGSIRAGALSFWLLTPGGQAYAWGNSSALGYAGGESSDTPSPLPWPVR